MNTIGFSGCKFTITKPNDKTHCVSGIINFDPEDNSILVILPNKDEMSLSKGAIGAKKASQQALSHQKTENTSLLNTYGAIRNAVTSLTKALQHKDNNIKLGLAFENGTDALKKALIRGRPLQDNDNGYGGLPSFEYKEDGLHFEFSV